VASKRTGPAARSKPPPDRPNVNDMNREDITFCLSIVGSVTAIVLAIIKVFEFWTQRRQKFGLDVGLTGSEDLGNTLVLLNRSNVPLAISYFDLAWVERRCLLGCRRCRIPFTRRVIRDDSPCDPASGYYATVQPHATHRLSFTGQYHFHSGVRLPHDIYLRLWIVGRRSPIWMWVTGPL
jgi:hypothetical protein